MPEEAPSMWKKGDLRGVFRQAGFMAKRHALSAHIALLQTVFAQENTKADSGEALQDHH